MTGLHHELRLAEAHFGFWNRRFSGPLVFGLGGGGQRVHGAAGAWELYPDFALRAFERLGFFVNRFHSAVAGAFLGEVREMVWVKRYPVMISAVPAGAAGQGHRLLLASGGRAGAYRTLRGGPAAGLDEAELAEADLLRLIGDRAMDWAVVLPPKRMIRANLVLRSSLLREARRFPGYDAPLLAASARTGAWTTGRHHAAGAAAAAMAGCLEVAASRLDRPALGPLGSAWRELGDAHDRAAGRSDRAAVVADDLLPRESELCRRLVRELGDERP